MIKNFGYQDQENLVLNMDRSFFLSAVEAEEMPKERKWEPPIVEETKTQQQVKYCQ